MVFVNTAWFAALVLVSATFGEHIDLDDFVDSINAMQSTWVAVRSPAADMRLRQMQQFRSILNFTLPSTIEIREHDEEFIRSLPESFHPREKWPNCPSFDEIRDQGACGSCWALAAVEAMTDRYCTYGNQQIHISAQDLLACCGTKKCGGCGNAEHVVGGNPSMAWLYWVQFGLVTGGNYGSNEGCSPYSLKNCSHGGNSHLPECGNENTPSCKTVCRDGYDKSYAQDKHYGKQVYTLVGEQQMMAEIYKNGPIEAGFQVYQDFAYSGRGVYQHLTGDLLGYHAVKILGWGVEDGVKYWLAANSWNTEWGAGGFFKIIRGQNDCLIESVLVIAGEPDLSR